jgi:type IV fimbrial biogenesis protein FimT
MRARGFTLIELMVALAIASMLLLMAAPLYTQWVADNQISNGAQSIADGLRIAQTEAVKRNVQIEFVLDGTAGSGGWAVQPVGGPAIRDGHFSEGADRAQFAIGPAGLTTVTFTGIGTIQRPNADGSEPFDTVDVTSSVAGTRSLRVLVGGPAAGARTGIKVCDPAWNAIDPTDPKACPAG